MTKQKKLNVSAMNEFKVNDSPVFPNEFEFYFFEPNSTADVIVNSRRYNLMQQSKQKVYYVAVASDKVVDNMVVYAYEKAVKKINCFLDLLVEKVLIKKPVSSAFALKAKYNQSIEKVIAQFDSTKHGHDDLKQDAIKAMSFLKEMKECFKKWPLIGIYNNGCPKQVEKGI